MAAISTFLRRVASSAAPIALAAVAGRQSYHSSALFRPLAIRTRASPFPSFSLSSLAKSPPSDASLLKVIDYEIKCAEESDDHGRKDEIPTRFPFEIRDDPGTKTITLSRESNGEHIEVVVSMPDLVTGEDGENDASDNDKKDTESGAQSSIPLVVKVSKGAGPSLEFFCTAYADEVAIDGLSVGEDKGDEELAYDGPDFSDLDENLQKAFHKYLEIRGISPSTTNFLHEYMINKDSHEYLQWLKDLKNFVVKLSCT